MIDCKKLIGDGKDFGIKITYKVQNKPKGIVDAFKIGNSFLKIQKNVLILGDNYFMDLIYKIYFQVF